MIKPLPIYLCLICICIFKNVQAQQIPNKTTFSTLDFSLNPALTATGTMLETGIFYRQQWLGFQGAPRTGAAYFQYPFEYNSMSAGIYFVHDEINLIDANEITFTYSYKLKTGLLYNDQLSMGFSATVEQTRFDGTNVISSSQNDPMIVLEDANSLDGNFGVGIFYTTNQYMQYNDKNTFYVGLAANQLIPSKGDILDGISIRKRIHANTLIGGKIVNGFTFIEPSIMINYTPNSPIHGRASILFEKENTFWTGLNYHTDNTIEVQLGTIIKWNDGFLRVGVLGGYSIGSLQTEKGFSYEASVVYQFEL